MTWPNFLRRKLKWVDVPMYVERRYIGSVKRVNRVRWFVRLDRPLALPEPHRGWLLHSRLVSYQCRHTPNGMITREVHKALLTIIRVGATWRQATRLAVSLALSKSVWTVALCRRWPYIRIAHEHPLS
ncbi:hypothetical protein [Aggregatilinea lenta]|uniref:hypothetical protein n=1 Tax=Aggregatilinea lenta TaxID=913108 RepID=UPI000E5B410C|nr:hypothetical protein [Aggregatilinea lenta]